MFTKILIANRGEIACRIIKTARRLGIKTVAIYSSVDRHSLHVTLAEEAFCVGEPTASKSYLNIDAIIAAARASGSEAIHPGYGFLSENSHFARACHAAGVTFIGPSVNAMDVMASKQLAKQLLEKTGVPLTPGYHGDDQSDTRLLDEARRLGFPVLLKAALGGGGKGMRAVHEDSHFNDALTSARREARACFADDTMLLEKLILNPRHVEIQLMADNHGHVVHVFDRDCSIQRRHQKIIEEAPAPNLPESLRLGLHQAAIAVARAIHYRGAGTVEFLVEDNQHFYFMEMNTRLQVEHPVTEMITGLDLVEWQLRIAANEPLPLTQSVIQATGHAIECRVYAEDPDHGFVPSMGQLHGLNEPVLDGVRIDSGVVCGDIISRYYDPMFAKIIAWGHSREQAVLRMQQALRQYLVGGVKTNLPFLQAILAHPAFVGAELSTDFLTLVPIKPVRPNEHHALMMAASVDYLCSNSPLEPVLADTFGWQMHLRSQWSPCYNIAGTEHHLAVTPLTRHAFIMQQNDTMTTLHVAQKGKLVSVDNGTQCIQSRVESHDDTFIVYTETGPVTVVRHAYQVTLSTKNHAANQLTAPMPATIVALLKKTGDTVCAGEGLIVLEAMKMEHTVHAPADGVLVELFYPLGAQVDEGALLAAIESSGNEKG